MIGHVFEKVFDSRESKEYLEEVIPFIAKLALSAPTLITEVTKKLLKLQFI